MKDLMIELILVAMIVVPAVADSLQPAKAIPNNRLVRSENIAAALNIPPQLLLGAPLRASHLLCPSRPFCRPSVPIPLPYSLFSFPVS